MRKNIKNPTPYVVFKEFSSLVSLGTDEEEKREKMLLFRSESTDELPVGALSFGPELETGAKSRDTRSHVGFATPRSIALVEVEIPTGRWFLTTVAHENAFYFFKE